MSRSSNLINYSKGMELTVRDTVQRIAYNAQNLPEYIGEAPMGSLSSDSRWTLNRITYDVNNLQTLTEVAFDSWDNRVTATYS